MVPMIEKEGVKIESKLIDGDVPVMLISLSGYVDQANCHILQEAIDQCLEQNLYNIVFDFRELVYMSSAGWGVLIGEIKRFRENGGDIKLANMGPEIYEIYQMLEFYHIISEFTSVEEALQSFYQKRGKTGMHPGKMNIVSTAPEDSRPNKNEFSENPIEADSGSEELSDEKEPESIQESIEELEVPLSDPELQNLLDKRSDKEESVPGNDDSRIVEEEIDIDLEDLLDEQGITTSTKAESKPSGYVEFKPEKYQRKVNVKVMPIPDKIRAIIAENPTLSPRQIQKRLRHPDYGSVKIGYFKLKRMLKELELDTKEKRFRYFRSA
ncbi:MAG: anti-sigma factor antagonist [Calditrichaeota bacterium]|nr:MAG: anti-sigma factor antagonist [Calditrichota bacterium]